MRPLASPATPVPLHLLAGPREPPLLLFLPLPLSLSLSPSPSPSLLSFIRSSARAPLYILHPVYILPPGLINVDFADVRAVMSNAGPALMGIGRGFGKTRARDAALAAVSSPLLDFPIEKAKGIVFTITGTSDMSLQEVNEVAAVIQSIGSDDANIIFGTSVDESYGDEISVTVVATSFELPSNAPPPPRGAAEEGPPPPPTYSEWQEQQKQPPQRKRFLGLF